MRLVENRSGRPPSLQLTISRERGNTQGRNERPGEGGADRSACFFIHYISPPLILFLNITKRDCALVHSVKRYLERKIHLSCLSMERYKNVINKSIDETDYLIDGTRREQLIEIAILIFREDEGARRRVVRLVICAMC